MTEPIRPGQTWECAEQRAADPQHDVGAEYSGLGSRYVRFTATVKAVDTDIDYVALTVGTRNRHIKAPQFGATVATTCSKLRNEPRWELYRESPSARRGERQ